MLPDIYNISGSHGDEQITLLAVGEQIILNLIKGWEIFAWSTKLLDPCLQILGRDSKIICFSCCINVCQNHMIGKLKSLCKFRKKSLGTVLSMRLEYAPQLLVWIIVCSV